MYSQHIDDKTSTYIIRYKRDVLKKLYLFFKLVLYRNNLKRGKNLLNSK